jgi:Uma2 family endonuclease
MGLPKPVLRLSTEAYLAWEAAQPTKNEFLAGEIFAMVGATDAHNTISLNVASLIKSHLRGGPCRVFTLDIKVRVQAADAYFYPDVFVTCDERDHANRLEKAHPKLIIEVLSESTADYDRGEKFAVFRRIAELEEYVLIDPDLQTIDRFQRGAAGEWILHDVRGMATLHLASIDLKLPTRDIFEGVSATRG